MTDHPVGSELREQRAKPHNVRYYPIPRRAADKVELMPWDAHLPEGTDAFLRYQAVVIPVLGSNTFGRPAAGADESERWRALADRLGYKAWLRGAYHQHSALTRAGSWLVGLLTAKRVEIRDRQGNLITTRQDMEAAEWWLEGKARDALHNAQIAATAATLYGLPFRASFDIGGEGEALVSGAQTGVTALWSCAPGEEQGGELLLNSARLP